MFLNPTTTLLLATLAATVNSAPHSGAAFGITLTNTNLSTTAVYTVSTVGVPVIVNTTAVFDQATLKCLYEIHIPEYHCLLQNKNLTRAVDVGPGKTQITRPMDVGRITCDWRLPEAQLPDVGTPSA